jgi:hypothetical protein
MDKTKELFLKFLKDMDFEIKTGEAYEELRGMNFGNKLIEHLEFRAAHAKLKALKLYGFKESELKRDNSLFLKWVPKTGNYDSLIISIETLMRKKPHLKEFMDNYTLKD